AGRARTETRAASRRLDQASQSFPPHIPVPRRHADSCPGILERLVLQPSGLEPERLAEREQSLLVGAHEVDHALAAHGVAVKPHAAVEGEAHPLAAACEFSIGRGATGSCYAPPPWPVATVSQLPK